LKARAGKKIERSHLLYVFSKKNLPPIAGNVIDQVKYKQFIHIIFVLFRSYSLGKNNKVSKFVFLKEENFRKASLYISTDIHRKSP